MADNGKGVKGIAFDEELGPVPRKPSFWLDDWFFWFPILKEACHGEPSVNAHIFVTTGWGGDIKYDPNSFQVTIPIGVACGFHNQYVGQLKIEASAAIATSFAVEDLYSLYVIYHNWGIDKEPWLLGVLFRAALEFKFTALLAFVSTALNREQMFAGEMLDDLLAYASSLDSISEAKRGRLQEAVRQEHELSDSANHGQTPVYDVALSFAGEDRDRAEAIATLLKDRGASVFYDKHEESNLWGKDLYEFLADVYSNKARFCIILISKMYAQKRWTTHERRNAQARAFRENREYILPVKIDDTQLPGIPETIGYMDLRRKSEADIVEAVIQKLEHLGR